jgi:hypothetical protein
MALTIKACQHFRMCTFFAARRIPFPERPTFGSSTAQFSPKFSALMLAIDASDVALI